jgi:ABC-type transporter Mla MlaB component
MAKEEPAPVGIFSKVVKFVRNPGTNWSELDEKESDRESAFTKQALKEMIERKRRNDFVRKREFDMLRKLRRREAVGGLPGDGSARPSFFQSSMPSKPDDRAQTIKKIDEIEAQMSMQWWKTKHGSGQGQAPTSSFSSSEIDSSTNSVDPAMLRPKPGTIGNLAYARTEPDDLTNALAMAAAASQEARAEKPPAPVAPQATPVAAQGAKPPMMGGLAASYDGTSTTGFTPSKLFSIDVAEVQHDPELEEAAIRFANGDDAGAEAGLLDALGSHGGRGHHEETWFTAFDLYRATGQIDRFESLAIDFASKFNRSAPMWFSIPEMVGQIVQAAPDASSAEARKSNWRAPANFGLQTIAALNAALARAPMPWVLDWSILKTIDDNAVLPLCRLFAGWAAQPVQLRFMGAQHLDDVLRLATPSGARDTNQDLWKLRLEYLRITHRPDEFELAALDFCVTYELSPPAWDSARCDYKMLDTDGLSGVGQTIIGEAVHDTVQSELGGYGDDGPATMQITQLAAVELSGQIQGDPAAALDKLEMRFQGADVLLISCAKLIRVDFSAAGTLLNWVSARQNEGRVVQFTDVHRLVAAFFHVIGISEHAKVVARID